MDSLILRNIKKDNMKRECFAFVICICLVQTSYGLPSLTCNDVDPISPSTVKCSCQNTGGPGINWLRGGVYLTQCNKVSGKCFSYTGYTFTVDSSTSTYTIEFGPYTYTECTNVTCSDSTIPSDYVSKTISLDEASFSPTISVINEPPSSHMNGNISFTTGCIYRATSATIDVTAKWIAVVNETEVNELDIDETIQDESGQCFFCTQNSASKKEIEFYHQEDQSERKIEAKIRLVLLLDGKIAPNLNKTTEHVYNVKGEKVRAGSKNAPCCDLICWIIIIIIIVVVIFCCCGYYCCFKTTWGLFCENTRAKHGTEGKKCNAVCLLKIACLLIPVYGCILFFIKKRKVEKEKPTEFTFDENSVTNNSFTVLWNPGPERKSNINYFLEWYSDKRKVRKDTIPYNGQDKMEYMIKDLDASTNYTVKIQALIGSKKSAFTKPLDVRTLDTPDKPKEFTFDKKSVTSKSVWLSWKPGLKRGSEHMFNLMWYTDDGNKGCVDIPHNGRNEMHHTLEGLLEATNYNVKIFAECNTVKLECDTEIRFKTKEGQLTVFRKKHKRIADSCEDEICCENCKKTGASLASHAYCLSDELYLCLKCLDKEHTNEECVLLWNTNDIKGKDHKLCCKENYKRDDLQLKGVCQTCKLFICSQCIEKHEHTDCSSHQQLHGPLNTRARMCCKRNKAKGRTETVDFCMQCKTSICASCLEHHNTHLVISNLKDVMDAETGFCCELNYKARGHESDDFCIQCKTFICASCLKEHTNHAVISAFTGLISTRAGMCCKLENNNKIKDFCIQCQTFICDPCKKNHNRHIIVSSMMASSKREFFCKGCPSVKRLPVECLALHKGVFLCASCYETGNLKKALKNKSKSQEPIVQNFTKNQKSCQVHEVLGNVKDLQVEVYCLVCQLYMCLGCFKKHRRIYDHWSKTLEGNLFYCNQCRTGELNPVECCDFTSLEFRCWQCYILNIRTSAKLSYTKEVTSKMHDLRDMKNPCQVHEDETRSTTKADVYCLVCKSDMCKSCFKKHINSEINQR